MFFAEGMGFIPLGESDVAVSCYAPVVPINSSMGNPFVGILQNEFVPPATTPSTTSTSSSSGPVVDFAGANSSSCVLSLSSPPGWTNILPSALSSEENSCEAKSFLADTQLAQTEPCYGSQCDTESITIDTIKQLEALALEQLNVGIPNAAVRERALIDVYILEEACQRAQRALGIVELAQFHILEKRFWEDMELFERLYMGTEACAQRANQFASDLGSLSASLAEAVNEQYAFMLRPEGMLAWQFLDTMERLDKLRLVVRMRELRCEPEPNGEL